MKKDIRKNQITSIEMKCKNTLDGIKSRLDTAEGNTSEFGDIAIESIQN